MILFVVMLSGCGLFFEGQDQDTTNNASSFDQLSITGYSPVSGASITDTNPVLKWNAVPGAVSYHFRMSSNDGYESQSILPTPIIYLDSPSYTHPTPLENGISYSWTVRAEDADGITNNWSSFQRFFLQWAPEDAIHQMSPGNDAAVDNSNLDFNWNPVNGAVQYEISISAGNTSIADITDAPQYVPTSQLYGEISWKVRPFDKDGQSGAWSEIKQFEITWDNTAQGLIPADGTKIADLIPRLSWEAVDGAVSYQIRWYNQRNNLQDETMDTQEAFGYISDFNNAPLQVGTTYGWQVRALWENTQYGPWSSSNTFTITWGAIGSAVPEEGSIIFNVNQELSWGQVLSTTKYHVQLAESTADLKNETIHETTQTSFTPTSPLAVGTAYQWRVRAINTNGTEGEWSRTREFTIGGGNLTDMLPSSGSSTFDTTPTLTWDTVSGAVKYEVQLNNNQSTVTEALLTPSSPYSMTDTLEWKVRAVDLLDNTGPWSSMHSLTFNDGTLSGMAPVSQSTLSDATPTHTWNAILGAAEYQIQLAQMESQLDGSEKHAAAASSYTSANAFGDSIFWRVRAVTDNGEEGPWTDALSLTIGDNYALIPAGTFMMGSAPNEPGRADDPYETQHEVTLTKSYYISPYETTQKEWKDLMNDNPSYYKGGDDHPVENIVIKDIYKFCNAMSLRAGLTPVYTISNSSVTTDWNANGYRIPTEAEWEYAARGNTTDSRYGDIDDIAWYDGNSGGNHHAVGEKNPNAYGLYDVLGNVGEFTADWFGTFDSNPVTDPRGPSAGYYSIDQIRSDFRPYRGGGASSSSDRIRAAYRGISAIYFTGRVGAGTGIRLARNPN